MISYLKGLILTKKERYAILLVNGTTGYRVHLTAQMMDAIAVNQDIAFFIYTHVREDAFELYGFPNLEELDFFELLIGISGVGPKSALGVLSVAPLEDIKKAIIHGDPGLLQRVSNIGKKTAERIIVELKEKITVTSSEEKSGLSITENVQLLEALLSLGYKEQEIRKTLRILPPEASELSDKIKEALRILSQNKQ